jgi:3-phosphoshikimate 1-carboxyvinyltransferase
MKLVAPSGPLRGEVELPISKSIANRYQIIAALAGRPLNLPVLPPQDVEVLRTALASETTEIHVGMAGTAMRFLTAYFAVLEGAEVLLVGDKRMYERPIEDLVEALQLLGAEISYLEKYGFPPLFVSGRKLNGGTINMSASVSSQFVSALMLVAPKMENGLTILLEGKILSRPYIELTAACMEQCGVDVAFDGNSIKIPSDEYQISDVQIESDWSAASYFYALAAARPNSKLLLKGLRSDSSQGDSVIAKWFGKMGVSSVQREKGVEISSSKELGFPAELAFIDHPDLAQTFAFLAATLGMSIKMIGLDNLRLKETDRVSALQIELKKLGIRVSVEANTMNVSGSILSKNALINTYNDHRMAMSAAVVSTVLNVEVENPQVVEKSFPTFWSELQKIGFKID